VAVKAKVALMVEIIAKKHTQDRPEGALVPLPEDLGVPREDVWCGREGVEGGGLEPPDLPELGAVRAVVGDALAMVSSSRRRSFQTCRNEGSWFLWQR